MGQIEVESILNEFGKSVGIPELGFDEDGYCCLYFDDIVLNLELNEDTENLFLYANVGEIPAEDREGFYEMLLEADYLYCQTAGGVLGVSKEDGMVTLAFQMPFVALDYGKFEKIIENFINVTEFWTNRVIGFAGSDESIETSDKFPTGIKV